MKPVMEETDLERAMFAARLHVSRATPLTDESVKVICEIFVRGESLYLLGVESEREDCAKLMEGRTDFSEIARAKLAKAIRGRR